MTENTTTKNPETEDEKINPGVRFSDDVKFCSEWRTFRPKPEDIAEFYDGVSPERMARDIACFLENLNLTFGAEWYDEELRDAMARAYAGWYVGASDFRTTLDTHHRVGLEALVAAGLSTMVHEYLRWMHPTMAISWDDVV